MGVPKFFRYMSERYPCLSELIKEHQIPEFDNLYLDMNGIVHNCSHPDDGNVQFRITEEQIFLDIFHYIETLFRLIKPQKLFFMAVDGVAPRAKMNQQRGRRFRSAKEAETLENQAKAKGEVLPETARFDSNCITPGTEFMVRLQDALKTFIKAKIMTNKLWQGCRIILSGHETPGEGEHKIMEYIRFLKAQPGFNPNTRHCLYGLDADLVMLGLCTHEIHFSLLREEVKFGKKTKKHLSVDNTRFYLLHLGLLRHYLELEFDRIKSNLPFPYSIENIIDDWILMGFMVGNDFIPHLPNLHINENALPLLYNAYMDVLPNLDGYINEGGLLNLKRLEMFMKKMADVDRELFKNHYTDFKYMALKQNDEETFGGTIDDNMEEMELDEFMNEDLAMLMKNSKDMYGDTDPDDEEALFEKEFSIHKRDYYINKLRYEEMNDAVLVEQTKCYITALQWTLHYYYRGVQSWEWYYPHHYAPFISDIQNFSNLTIKFDMGKPFKPFEQLLAVLPASSKPLLPNAYHHLMTSPDSEVIDYYPTEFETDKNGKKQEWEAVVLIPFIDEKRLIAAMKKREHLLSENEINRNKHGPMYQYECLAENDETKSKMQPIYEITELSRQDIEVPENKLVLGPTTNTQTHDIYYPGFPTMKHLSYTGQLLPINVRVFDQPAKNESMVLKIVNNFAEDTSDFEKIVQEYMDTEVFIGWPHLTEGKVVAISTKEKRCDATKKIEDNDERVFDLQVKGIVTHHTSRMGIDFGNIEFLLHVCPVINREYLFSAQGKMTLSKVYDDLAVPYPIQAVVKELSVHEDNCVQYKCVEDIFTENSIVFMKSTVYYGCQGTVVDPSLVKSCGRIKVSLTVHPEPDFSVARERQEFSLVNYQNAYETGRLAGISNSVLSRITGTILIIPGQKRFPLGENTHMINIGLQFKFPKKNEEIIGYTKRIGNQFLYSKKVVQIVSEYYMRCQKLFDFLSKNNTSEIFESDIFPKQNGELQKLADWIKELPQFSTERRACGTESLEKETMEAIVEAVNELKQQPHKCIKLQVKPYLLYKPNLNMSGSAPDPNAKYKLFDRVVVTSDTFLVPLGFKGTVVGIQPVIDPNPVRLLISKEPDFIYDILFDEPFGDGITIEGVAEKRLFKVSKIHLINISYGVRMSKPREPNVQKITMYSGDPKIDNLIKKKISSDTNPTKSESSVKEKQLWSMLLTQNENTKKIDLSDDKPNTIVAAFMKNVVSNEKNVSVQSTAAENISTLKETNLSDNLSILSSHNKTPNDGITFIEALGKSIKTPTKIQTSASTDGNSDSDGCTDTLKKWLRISDDQSTTHTKKSQDLTNQATTSINVEDLFKVDTYSLPKPPQTWRTGSTENKLQFNNNQNAYGSNSEQDVNNKSGSRLFYASSNTPQYNGASYLQSMHVPPPNKQNFIYHPQPQQHQQRYNVPPPIIPDRPQIQPRRQNLDFFSQPPNFYYNNSSQGPNGPQNLASNSVYSPGKGAFIPLQAIRQQSKQQQSHVQPVMTNSIPNVNGKNNRSTKKAEEKVPPIISSTTTDVPIASKCEKKKKVVAPTRPCRIAAKFDIQP